MPGGTVSAGPSGAGLFGKLPAHGDFVARGDPALVGWFEGWLTQGLGRLAGKHESLDALLARAPVWRFAVRREGEAVAGALIPSRDGVGRLFPLLLFTTCDTADALALADAIAGLPFDMATTADEAIGAVAGAMPAEAIDDDAWPGADRWRSDAGESLVFDTLPVGDDFARLFVMAEAAA